jgi:hypothetical protein
MNQPRVFSVSMVKNEADIIEAFVRYNLNVVDGMLIVDHSSSDRTNEILKNLLREGLPVFLSSFSTGEHVQGSIVSRLVYEAFDVHHADLVLPLDADEFLVAADQNPVPPRQILNELSQGAIYNVFWRTFFPHESDHPQELLVPKRIRYRTDQLAPGLESARSKVIITRDVALRHRVHVGNGSHKLTNRRRVRNKIPHKDLDSLKLAHFPIRSIDQARSKVFIGWLNSLARPDRRPNDCAHWQDLFERLKAHYGDFSVRDMQLMTAIAYLRTEYLGQVALDLKPMDLSFCQSLETRYTTLHEIDPLRNVVDNAEILSKQYSKLKRDSCSVSKSAAHCVANTIKSFESLFLGEILGVKPKDDLHSW